MRARLGFMGAVIIAALIVASVPVSAGGRPRGGNYRCLEGGEPGETFVSHDVDDLVKWLDNLSAIQTTSLLKITSSTYGLTFADRQISVFQSATSINQILDEDEAQFAPRIAGDLVASAVGSYRIRASTIVITDVTEDIGSAQISVGGAPGARNDVNLFPSGRGRLRFTCRGATLTLFDSSGDHLKLTRQPIPASAP